MRFDVTAIGLGILSDFALSALGAVIVSLTGFNTRSPDLFVWSLIVGLVAIFVGGYVTFVKSQSSAFANTIAFGVIEIIIGAVLTISSPMPAWFVVASLLLILPTSLAGGYFVQWLRHHEA